MTTARFSFSTITYAVLSALLLLAAVLFYGAFGSHAAASAVSLSSSNAKASVARTGDTVTLSFSTPVGSQTPVVTIDGQSAVTTGGPTAWTSTLVLGSTDPAGAVTFSVATADGSVTSTTDHSYVTFFKAAPVGELTSVKAVPNTPTALTSLPILAYFSEPLASAGNGVVSLHSFTTTNARVTSIQIVGNDQVFLVTIAPMAAGPFSITLPSGAVTDVAGNTTGSATLAFTYDPHAVAVTSVVSSKPMTGTMTPPSSMTPSTSDSMQEAMAPTSSMKIGTSSMMIGTSTDAGQASSTSTTTVAGTASPAVWLGIIVILIILVGGGWWYSRNITPTV